ncbi:ATP synthase regulation protein NCA2-domain-containing protein [Chytridium lagenaria]|nr:ATP synthase regulation protein NCA2-domain-containing protein [Chytridium lagenaria]
MKTPEGHGTVDYEHLLFQLATIASRSVHDGSGRSAIGPGGPEIPYLDGKSLSLLNALQSIPPPPPITSIVHTRPTSSLNLLERHLTDVMGYLERDVDVTIETVEVENAEGFFLVRALEVLNYHVAAVLMAACVEAAPVLRYWKYTEGTPWRVFIHAVEEAPVRLVKGIWESVMDGKSSFQDVSFRLRRSVTTVGLGIASALIKPPTFLDAAKRRIDRRVKGLEVLNLRWAGYLGVLCEVFSPLKSEEVTISSDAALKYLFTIEAVLKRIVSHQEFPEKDSLLKVYNDVLNDSDALLSTISKSSHTKVSNKDLYQRTLRCLDIVKQLPQILTLSQRPFNPPSFLQRAWLPFAATTAAYLLARSSISFSDIHSLYSATVETVYNFAVEWVVRPIRDILETIRHKEGRLALMGSESLNSDLESLQRMVVAFAKDHGVVVGGDALEALAQSVQRGDLTVVLERYEEDIKSPLQKALSGDLIRSLLIQVQKGKVDLELAMSALDKLLKANELNFAFLAVAPTLLLIYFGTVQVEAYIRRQRAVGMGRVVDVVRASLRQIETILVRSSEHVENPTTHTRIAPLESGLLICEIAQLRSVITSNVKTREGAAMLEDLKDLTDIDAMVGRKNAALMRMKEGLMFMALRDRA